MDKRFLIIARVGDQSTHANWLLSEHKKEEDAPQFDLFLSYAGCETHKYKNSCTFYDQQKGEKWPVLSNLVEQYWELISTYEAIWFADDALITNTHSINRLFNLFSGHQLALAQPALSFNSFYDDPIFLQQPTAVLRFVNGIESLAPLMTNHTLALLHPTFNNPVFNNSCTHKMATQWPALITNPNHSRIAIIDAAPVTRCIPLNDTLKSVNKKKIPYKIYSSLKISQSHFTLHAYLRAFWHRATLTVRSKRARRKAI